MNPMSFFLNKSKYLVALAVIAGLISGIGSAGALALINMALSGSQFSARPLILGFAALALTSLAGRLVSEIVLTRLTQRAIFDLRLYLTRQILATPLRQLETIGAPKLLSALTDDVLAITGGFMGIPGLCTNVASLIIFLIYLGSLSWIALVGIAGFMILGLVSHRLLEVQALRALTQARRDQNDLLGHFRSLTEGIKELKIHHPRRSAFLSDLLLPTATSFQRHNMLGLSLYSVAGTWVQSLLLLCMGLIVFGLPLIPGITAPVVISSAFALMYLVGPVLGIMAALPGLGRAQVATRNLQMLGLAGSDTAQETGTPLSTPAWSSLELIGVLHTYHRGEEDGDFQLGPIDLTFRPGRLAFLTGGNGSGKTTLAKLLAGLYVPESGEIRLDGRPITGENREAYRQLFSIVFSDFYLFDRLLGVVRPDLDAQARQYLARLQLQHKLTIEDGILSTTELSQGQRKRLALLTAYLEDRSFYVFDEWAADQDPVFREIFYTQLLPDLRERGKVVLVITHDDRYYHLADDLIKLDYGELVSPSTPLPEPIQEKVAVLREMGAAS
jgi:putative pyoverdin transport system ATP-binding/permease protein